MADEFFFEALAEALFVEPTGILYHYTSLGGFTSIVRSGRMYASDIRYLNDSAEMRHALTLVGRARERRQKTVEEVGAAGGNISVMLDPSLPPMLLYELDEQLRTASCYVACFTKQGNQLSQWRGYCPPRKGISIGFDAADLRASAEAQDFVLRECVYNSEQQELIGDQLLNALKFSPDSRDAARRHELYSSFQQIAAVLKHPRFAEEQECRVISKEWHADNPRMNIDHREGKSMLIPYTTLSLPRDANGRLKIARVMVGPTPHVYEALLSVTQFLMLQEAADHIKRVEYCDIPLRDA